MKVFFTYWDVEVIALKPQTTDHYTCFKKIVLKPEQFFPLLGDNFIIPSYKYI